MKRILCTLLLLFILFSACPISAYAQVIEEELTDGIVYTINSKTGEVIIKGNGEIPDYSTSPFLYLNGDIKSVLIESGILKIGARLFRNCTSLEKISISDKVTQIDNTAFDGCTGIKEFSVDIENEVYSSFDGILYSKDLSKLIK
ncbi:MAG: leucine-rich repeat protein, partial [Eubacterium sp.]